MESIDSARASVPALGLYRIDSATEFVRANGQTTTEPHHHYRAGCVGGLQWSGYHCIAYCMLATSRKRCLLPTSSVISTSQAQKNAHEQE